MGDSEVASEPEVAELGFPTEKLSPIVKEARSRYPEQVAEQGPANGWRHEEARWHIWKACEELFKIRWLAGGEQHDRIRRHCGSALNSMVFAMDIVHANAHSSTPTTEADSETYPDEHLASLICGAKAQFREQVEEHGAGKNWMEDDPNWHIWKAGDELFQARNPAHNGKDEQTRYHCGDALNHLLFAIDILHAETAPRSSATEVNSGP